MLGPLMFIMSGEKQRKTLETIVWKYWDFEIDIWYKPCVVITDRGGKPLEVGRCVLEK